MSPVLLFQNIVIGAVVKRRDPNNKRISKTNKLRAIIKGH